MQLSIFFALLFVVAVSAEEVVSNVQPPVVAQQQPQGQVMPVVHSAVEHAHSSHHQPGEPMEHEHAIHHQQQQQQHHQNQQHLYAPAGMIQMVGPQQYSAGQGASGASEQYGKPESASIPPNYKPFGSWGLYIGGNPADGYYTNYYKALGNSVDKQQVAGVEQASGAGNVKPVAAGPMLKQATYPYGSYADQVYPFDYYTPADLNSGSRVALVDQSPAGGPSVYAAGALPSPVQVGSQVYGAPSAIEQPMLSYATDSYSTKRIGSAPQSSSFMASKGQERVQPQPQPQQQQQMMQVQYQQVENTPAKGQFQQQQQQTRYMYAPVAGQHYQQHYSAQPVTTPQVVAYPVPVGSQIVGSQPGTEGAYAPYGVHGYTRYAVKPTMVATSEQHHYHNGVHSAPVAHFPAYKQQQQQQNHHYQPIVQPMSFYGYPLNQLHYSQGSIVPAFGQQTPAQVAPSAQAAPAPVPVGEQQQPPAAAVVVPAAGPPAPGQFETASSDKSETQSASEQNKPKEQKRA